MVKFDMSNKGFAEIQTNIETPNGVNVTEKPLKTDRNRIKRVDINILKSKLQETESKEFKKNLIILSSLIIGLGILGIYLSFWEYLQIFDIRDLIEIWKILT